MKLRLLDVIFLIGVYFVYALTFVFTKMASVCNQLSIRFFLWIGGAVCVLGIYAILWQQIIRRIPLSTAYMFKGTSLFFVLLISVLFFHESISIMNLVGAAIIVAGIALFAKE